MKKYFLLFVAFFSYVNATFAQGYRLSLNNDSNFSKDILVNKDDDFVLMRKVYLKNPENSKLGLEAGGPKYSVYKPVVKVKTIVEPVPVIENVDVVEDVNVIENKPVAEKKIVVDNNKVEPVIEKSQTDKNIEEAKKLLKVAEKIANSVAEEDFEAKPVKSDVSSVKKNPDFSMKFTADNDELKKVDEERLSRMVPKILENPDISVKMISYYSVIGDRNVAFSRLLNARKVLLEKNVPTSQIMILVLEDEDQSKNNTIDVFINK